MRSTETPIRPALAVPLAALAVWLSGCASTSPVKQTERTERSPSTDVAVERSLPAPRSDREQAPSNPSHGSGDREQRGVEDSRPSTGGDGSSAPSTPPRPVYEVDVPMEATPPRSSTSGELYYSGDASRLAEIARRRRTADDAALLEQIGIVSDEVFPDMYFRDFGVNPTIDTAEERFSTFSVDVDSASYSLARSYLRRGALIPEEAVRVEEFVNALDYDYAPPVDDDFSVNAEAFPSPHRPSYHVLHLGIKGREVSADDRAPANLVFVIDVSGSMDRENRLGLVKRSLRFLVDQLRSDDRVGIVAYGAHARVVLRPVPGADRRTILRAIDTLTPDGSTNAQAGIELGYALLDSVRRRGDINRIVLCSDGVANTGLATSAEAILATIPERRREGVSISAVGFGMGNYNDVLMEQLAQIGEGNYAYVDDEVEARRIFVENLTGTLQVIAKDVKIQLELDPDAISRYRLIGYENRALDKRDFDDDRVDAGEIGAGHAVTAIYEVKFRSGVRDLGWLRLRYKHPEGGASREIVKQIPHSIVRSELAEASAPARLSLLAATFAEKLRGSYWVRDVGYPALTTLWNGLPRHIQRREPVRELRDLMDRAAALDRREDRYSGLVHDDQFDRVPILE